MATNVGEAIIKLNFDTNALSNGLATVEKSMASVSTATETASTGFSKLRTVGLAASTAIAVGVKKAVSAVTDLAKSSVDAYADYEQLSGGVETLFGESSDALMEYAKNAYKTAGVSANEYMEMSTSFAASLTQSLGGDTAAAVEYANTAITDMSDNANKMGTDITAIQNAYQGFAKQNYTMLDNLKLGYGGTKTEMERLLEDAEKIKAANGEMADYSVDSFADIVEAIHVVQENMNVTGTTAQEAEQTISGSLNMLKASWEDLQVGIASGEDLSTKFENFKNSLLTYINNIGPVFQQAFEGIAQMITELAPVIAEKLPEIINTLLPAILTALGQIVNAIITSLPTIFSTIGNTISQSPELQNVLIAGVTGLIGVVVGKIAFTKVFSALTGKIKSGLSSVFSNGFKSAGSTLSSSGSGILSKISSLGTKIKNGLVKALGGLKEILTSLVNTIMEPIKALMKGIAEAIANFFTALANPQIAVGAAMFAVAAAAVAAAILLIGSAIGVVTPSIAEFMNTVIIPLASFIATTLLTALNVITDCIIRLSNEALIPVGEFLRDTFVIVVESVNNAIISLTQNAIVPLVETISGAFIGILNSVSGVLESVGNVINNIVKTALEGIQGTITAVGTAFESMGNGIKAALDGVSGVLSSFKDIIMAIGNAIIATVALATGRSVNYGTGYAHVFAEGGRVIGPGTGTSDSIPAMLSNGEYIIKAESAKSIGYDALDKLNATGDFETSPLTKVVMNSGEESGAGEGVVVNMNVYVNNEMDASDIGRKLEESIRRYV